MANIRFSGKVIVFCLGMFFLHFPLFAAQDVPADGTMTAAESASDAEQPEPLTIKVSVKEVRLDVVVLDKKRNPVTDLTAADFEVYQNNRRQEVLSSVYVENQHDAALQPSDSRKNSRNLPPLPTANPKREDIHRTIIFVVDDLSMSFENGYYAKMALRNFVEKQMQPGDMVAILRTGYGNSALQMFLYDRREALARIEAMRMERALPLQLDGSPQRRIFDNQLSTLSYSIRALKDMPGRKILIMMTVETRLLTPKVKLMFEDPMGDPIGETDFYALYNERFIRLADDALRAGVVVSFLNIDGLQQYDPNIDASINYQRLFEEAAKMDFGHNGASYAGALLRVGLNNLERKRDQRGVLNPLPVRTGGVTIENSNFFLDGLGRETESLMKGYYLISYAPPPDTFSPDDKEIYHKIKIKVKRNGAVVHTRDGFFNRIGSETAGNAPENPLTDAIFSPFQHADLNVNMAAGYVKSAKAGYLVRSWIHLDPVDVKIVETENGGAKIDLEMVCLTSDTNGFVQDFKHAKHTLNIDPENKAENIAWIQKHGIRFAMLLPVKNPGSYYVRIAVEDKESGKTGSAYQFVGIPNLEKNGLALSSIFMVASAEDLKWLLSDTVKESSEGVLFPVFQEEEVRSPALRTYEPGDRLQTIMVLYNADKKAIAGSEIEVQSIVYKNGVELRRRSIPITASDAENPNGILIMQRLTVVPDMPHGDYAQQLIVTDKKNGDRKESSASQALSFTVIEK